MNKRQRRWAAAILLLGTQSACGGDDAPDQTFAEYWSDSSVLCGRDAECAENEGTPCRFGFDTLEDTEGAMELAMLTDADLASCEAASRRFDTCFVTAPCENADTGPVCVEQGEAAFAACTTLYEALTAYYAQQSE